MKRDRLFETVQFEEHLFLSHFSSDGQLEANLKVNELLSSGLKLTVEFDWDIKCADWAFNDFNSIAMQSPTVPINDFRSWIESLELGYNLEQVARDKMERGGAPVRSIQLRVQDLIDSGVPNHVFIEIEGHKALVAAVHTSYLMPYSGL